MNFDYNTITALAAMVTALAAMVAAIVMIFTLCFENKRSRFSLGVDLLLKLDERYDSARMRKFRQSAAKFLLNGSLSSDENVDEILDFFEMVGLLVRRGALDARMVWNNFFYFISGYWDSAKRYVQKARGKDSTVWCNFEFLHTTVIGIEKRERRCSDSDVLPLSEDEIKKFLESEYNWQT